MSNFPGTQGRALIERDTFVVSTSYPRAYPLVMDHGKGTEITIPIAHHDGNYTADGETLRTLNGEDRVAFRYARTPNGSMDDIAGVLSANRRVLGMMPHPERVVDASHGGTDGLPLFRGIAEGLVAA